MPPQTQCIAGGIMFSGCSSVRPCVPNIVDTISWKSIGLIFTKLSALVHFETKMNASSFGVKRSKFKVTLLPVSLSCHLASIHQRALILFIQTLALYKSFTYLLTYLLTYLRWIIKLENARLCLVNAISWKLLDWISPNFQRWCVFGHGWMRRLLGQKVRGQGHSMTRVLQRAEAYRAWRCVFDSVL